MCGTASPNIKPAGARHALSVEEEGARRCSAPLPPSAAAAAWPAVGRRSRQRGATRAGALLHARRGHQVTGARVRRRASWSGLAWIILLATLGGRHTWRTPHAPDCVARRRRPVLAAGAVPEQAPAAARAPAAAAAQPAAAAAGRGGRRHVRPPATRLARRRRWAGRGSRLHAARGRRAGAATLRATAPRWCALRKREPGRGRRVPPLALPSKWRRASGHCLEAPVHPCDAQGEAVLGSSRRRSWGAAERWLTRQEFEHEVCGPPFHALVGCDAWQVRPGRRLRCARRRALSWHTACHEERISSACPAGGIVRGVHGWYGQQRAGGAGGPGQRGGAAALLVRRKISARRRRRRRGLRGETFRRGRLGGRRSGRGGAAAAVHVLLLPDPGGGGPGQGLLVCGRRARGRLQQVNLAIT